MAARVAITTGGGGGGEYDGGAARGALNVPLCSSNVRLIERVTVQFRAFP